MIDTGVDYRADSRGKDPDRHSARLKEDHRILWGRELPTGGVFTLADAAPGYLRHESARGSFSLGSDAIVPTFHYWERLAEVMRHIPDSENEEFERVTYSPGGVILFPDNRVDDKPTINQARGTNRAIDDRFDLTLESIRRHYAGGVSPLSGTLARYGDFFALFGDFDGYVEFFLLQDLVEGDGIRWWMPFTEFGTPAHPTTVDDYLAYRTSATAFVTARNARIAALLG